MIPLRHGLIGIGLLTLFACEDSAPNGGAASRETPEVRWTAPLPKAPQVGDAVCAECHADIVEQFEPTTMRHTGTWVTTENMVGAWRPWNDV